METPEINKRIKQVIDYYTNGVVKKFAENSEIQQQTLNRLFIVDKRTGKYPTVTTEILQKISEMYEISPEWLLTGRGSMLKSESRYHSDVRDKIIFQRHKELDKAGLLEEGLNPIEKEGEKPILINNKLIPFYDSEVEGGVMQVSSMSPAEEPAEMINAGDWFRDADCAMRVHGDSMYPVYKSGSIVVMKQVHDKKLIVFGQDYVVQTSEYRVIKRLQKSTNHNCWLACSVNEETWQVGEMTGKLIHEPFDIECDSVDKLFRVLGCVSRNESSRIVYNK